MKMEIHADRKRKSEEALVRWARSISKESG